MPIISVNNYIRDFGEQRCEVYLSQMARHAIRSGFLKWQDATAANWAGPWKGNHVFYSLRDCREFYPYRLASIGDGMRSTMENAAHRAYSVPARLIADIDRTMVIDGTTCERSTLTAAELQQVMVGMTPEENLIYKDRVAKEVAQAEMEKFAYPSTDRPFRIHLAGNDDCSHSLCVGSRSEAEEILEHIERSPTFETLKARGFVFTN